MIIMMIIIKMMWIVMIIEFTNGNSNNHDYYNYNNDKGYNVDDDNQSLSTIAANWQLSLPKVLHNIQQYDVL